MLTAFSENCRIEKDRVGMDSVEKIREMDDRRGAARFQMVTNAGRLIQSDKMSNWINRSGPVGPDRHR